jgi:hypothetical protein
MNDDELKARESTLADLRKQMPLGHNDSGTALDIGEDLIAEVRRLRAENDWRSIDTAPQDRGFIAAYNADRDTFGMVCWWPGGGWNGEGCWGWLNESIAWSRQRGNQPTHWKPLTAPKKLNAETGQTHG